MAGAVEASSLTTGQAIDWDASWSAEIVFNTSQTTRGVLMTYNGFDPGPTGASALTKLPLGRETTIHCPDVALRRILCWISNHDPMIP